MGGRSSKLVPVGATSVTIEAIGEGKVTALAAELKANTTLTSLSCAYNGIGGAGSVAMADALKTSTTLKSLILRHNCFGDIGAVAMAEALRVVPLTSLDFSANGIYDVGAAALAAALRVNTSLTSLQLAYNNIGPALHRPLRKRCTQAPRH